MRRRDIEQVEAEVKRLLERLNVLQTTQGKKDHYDGSRDTGAVKRSSMDLSNALVRLRHG